MDRTEQLALGVAERECRAADLAVASRPLVLPALRGCDIPHVHGAVAAIDGRQDAVERDYDRGRFRETTSPSRSAATWASRSASHCSLTSLGNQSRLLLKGAVSP